MSYRKYLMTDDVPPSELYKTVKIDTDSDTISRQAAIDICRAPHMRNADCSDFEMAIMMLPPAQPEQLGTNLAEVGTDCISRQAAIDALNNIEIPRNASWYQYYQQALTAVGKLPPAQSETAKRIVGKSKDGMTLWYQCDMCNEPVDAQDNFCRECGRRLIDE